MISQDLLEILCCPETHQGLELADRDAVENLNRQIALGQARNRGGQVVKEAIDGGLIRADKKFLYPVRKDIPVLLIDEALPLGS